METKKLKRFAQFARRSLIEQIAAKLNLVMAEGSVAWRESPKTLKELQSGINQQSKEQVIERVAYIWFNRFCALRFMDVNRYTRIAVVSPDEGQFQPEILAEAKRGHIDEDMMPEKTRQQIFALLDDKAPSRDPQGEAYRLLVVAVCNDWNRAMPFLFERINDYTELLMPDDLLSGNSILAYTREAMTPDACQDVEVIGWLYQFYISEKKDEVFNELKKNKKVTPENIPAATQLFTPHWIVRYLLENSLGRLWMLNRPTSKLVEQMDYYIKPEQPETDFLRISKPEEIKICDPACGSGHMLTYAFDLLYAIYEEEGYEPAEISEKILTHNLYGIEIDERAGELAAFALSMKARAKQRRFFRKPVQPNICVLENILISPETIRTYLHAFGQEIFSPEVVETLHQFEEADNFGSLIIPKARNPQSALHLLSVLREKSSTKIGTADGLTKKEAVLVRAGNFGKILTALRQADYLSPKYHVVIANPPYMGGKGMNGRLVAWTKDHYPKSKSDLFAMFIERNLDLARKHGLVAMITMQSWMFLSSFEALRASILGQDTILSMAHLGTRAFDSIGGAVVSTTAFVIANTNKPKYQGDYLRLVGGNSEAEKESAIREAIRNPKCGWFYRSSSQDLSRLPGSPVAYWAGSKFLDAFSKVGRLGPRAVKGLDTNGNIELFLKRWFEVSSSQFKPLAMESDHWYPIAKGGDFRRWYGNNEFAINYQYDGSALKANKANLRNVGNYFRDGLNWTVVSSGGFAVRYMPEGFLFDQGGSGIFLDKGDVYSLGEILGSLNSAFVGRTAKLLCPTLNFTTGDVRKFPIRKDKNIERVSTACINLSKSDWDSYEISWDFDCLLILNPDYRQPTLKAAYKKLRTHWREMTQEMQRVEEENNRIFIDAYGLKDELTPEVPLSEITLTCNPRYRYSGDKTSEELEALLLADTMRELISYAVGCMFGRYALEKPGLILANQGETIEDYLKQVPESNFPADDDNVIPMLDGDWFTDDISERFRKFLRVTFGEEYYADNMTFIEMALGKKGKARNIRDYFLKDFYTDHVKRYKKRPIYWLFSSPKGSFNALIYMHRYRSDTVSVVLNDYLREFRTKLTSHKNHLEAVSRSTSASQSEKIKVLKEIEKVGKMITEMEAYEREVLYPLAAEQVEIDLDDGVKVNYPKFGTALKKIAALNTKKD